MGEKILVLRTCDKNMKSYNNFVYPAEGWVEAPDWDGGKDCCGGGLHGFKWGVGNGSLANWDARAKWLVIAVDSDVLVDVTEDGGGKCKFKGGDVVYCGDRKGATDYLATNGAADKPIVGGTATAGDGGTATAGYGGTATAGAGGTATAGYRGTATAGYGGTATAGARGTATAGAGGTATAGDGGTATAGAGGTATAGAGGTATAGYGGTATAGYGGTATAGARGTATAGYRGTATAGYGGLLVLKYWDGTAERHRIATAYVGEDGIDSDTPYRYDVALKQFVKATGDNS